MTYGDEDEPHTGYEVEKILAEGINEDKIPVMRVKWVGYKHPTLEPQSAFEATAAMDVWERANPPGSRSLQLIKEKPQHRRCKGGG